MKARAVVNGCNTKRLHITIYGAVQGVGFRPYIYQLAEKFQLKGKVYNTSSGLIIEVEGEEQDLDDFLSCVPKEKPQNSYIENIQYNYLDPIGFDGFQIVESDQTLPKIAYVQPDLSTCSECLKEIFDSNNRRYLYPFTNCTHCGPRFSIIEALPYDRANTSMRGFVMCTDCQNEYDDPKNRRFHAQPNACSKCGPHVSLWDKEGKVISSNRDAITNVVTEIKTGKVVAVKGIGGFHLFADATNSEAVARLRRRKHREEKPFAVMFPNLQVVEKYCVVDEKEKLLLTSVEAPIVLLQKNESQSDSLAGNISFSNPYLGVMLPYSPLHHIMMDQLRIPVVATSGNLSDEPICTDENEALIRMKDIADYFLIHDRPIVRSIDDSVVRIMAARPQVIRRSRGYAPLPVPMKKEGESILGVGGHLKNTIAMNVGNNVFISQHIGDLETNESLRSFEEIKGAMQKLYEVNIKKLACDKHPEYLSTKTAKEEDVNIVEVQHHHAHIVSCMAENQIQDEVLGIAWDGTGFGEDGMIWGGEFLNATLADFKRVATFKSFMLPSGEKAIKEPKRIALGVLYEIFGDKLFEREDLPLLNSWDKKELSVMHQMLVKGVNSPLTSSVGRLFDAVAALCGLCSSVNYEGQAAMQLEFVLTESKFSDKYSYTIDKSDVGLNIIDWSYMFEQIIKEVNQGVIPAQISAKFHNTLIEMAVDVVKMGKCRKVVLSGGCFQNKYLTENLIGRLIEENYKPYWHQQVPPNDGGISLGQVAVALNQE